MKHRKGKLVAKVYMASTWQSQDTNTNNVSKACVLNYSILLPNNNYNY